MTSTNKVSVALCTYNGKRFLPAQLDSILNQTRLPDELIICDDCSTDDTEKIVFDFAEKTPFSVSFIKNEFNLGSTKNFEKAISHCSGDIIFLSDQDDIWLENKIELMMNEFEKNIETGLIFTDAFLVDENLVLLNKKLWEVTFPERLQKLALEKSLLEVLIKQNIVTGATTAFRAELKEFFQPFPTHIPDFIHDAWIGMVAALQSRVKFIKQPLIKYRQHSTQQLGVNLEEFRLNKNAYDLSINYYLGQKERNKLISELLISKFELQKDKILRMFQMRNIEIDEIIAHYENRRDLPNNLWQKTRIICREYLSGRYSKHSKGIFSAAKDFAKTDKLVS